MNMEGKIETATTKKKKAPYLFLVIQKGWKSLQSYPVVESQSVGEPHTIRGPIIAAYWKKKPQTCQQSSTGLSLRNLEQCLSRSYGLKENDPVDREKPPPWKN